MTTRVLVTGAGGFIGHHLVTYLKARATGSAGVDLKLPEYTPTDADEFELLDLRRWDACLAGERGGIDQVYALAADMGGMGFISAHHAEILHNNALINLHTLEAARLNGVSALPLQLVGLRLSGVPADRRRREAPPRGGRLPGPAAGRLRLGEARHRAALRVLRRATTGWRRASSASTTSTGPYGTYDGGREKAPAALVPQGRAGRGRRRDRDLGRRRADAVVLLHRRLRRGHLPADAVRPSPSRSTSAPTGW